MACQHIYHVVSSIMLNITILNFDYEMTHLHFKRILVNKNQHMAQGRVMSKQQMDF